MAADGADGIFDSVLAWPPRLPLRRGFSFRGVAGERMSAWVSTAASPNESPSNVVEILGRSFRAASC